MKMNRDNMPPDWAPPAPAWTTGWGDNLEPVVSAYFAVQSSDSTALDAWAEQALFGKDAPPLVEQGRFTDVTGIENRLYIAYWRQPQYTLWWGQHQNWWRDPARLAEPGYWREVFTMPLQRTETLHSSTVTHGMSLLAEDVVGPIAEHGYAGGMRDRVPVSSSADLRETQPITASMQRTHFGDKGVVIRPPLNMCVIRSGQNWRDCESEEKTYYLEKLRPSLVEGMRFLRDNPGETHCFSMRLVTRTDRAWQDLEESFGLGYATDIFAFENWAKSHPTHLAIFNNFLTMAGHFGESMKLRLWHEVTALDGEDCEFEYIGCHEATGLLPYS